MPRKKKTYLELFLDNTEAKKSKEQYWGDREEKAIIAYNTPETMERLKTDLYNNIIEPGFKNIISGVFEMYNFRVLPRGLSKDKLSEDALDRLTEKMGKYNPSEIGKNGQPVKTFSYFSTIAKNFILEKKSRHEKILKNKADVETSIDLSILSEDTLQMMSNYDKQDIFFEDAETSFVNMKARVITIIEDVIKAEESKNRPDADLIKIGYHLKYLLTKWDKIEFMKKNEFMRILTMYTGMKQQHVSFLFKKFKNAVLKKIRPAGITKVYKTVDDDSLFGDSDAEEVDDEIIIDEDEEKLPEIPEDKEIPDDYEINSFEEFEIQLEKYKNKKYKAARKESQIVLNESEDCT